MPQGGGQRTVRVAPNEARAAHPPLGQDARVDEPRHLTVRGRISHVSTLGEIGQAQLVAGKQESREQACLTIRPEDRREQRGLSSHVLENIIYHTDIGDHAIASSKVISRSR